LAQLSAADLRLLGEARYAVLATLRADGTPRLVPCTYAFSPPRPESRLVLYTPLDAKRKSVAEPRLLARVRDIAARPRVGVLAHRWDEDWRGLAWLRMDGEAALLEPPSEEHRDAVELLRARYAPYAVQDLEARPMIRIEVDAIASWRATP
jgi:PPOX class probable F420-dependent enzyme